ncbi:DUF971 domain-containing protein [Chitiniphilus eburneus]|uniref:DUF971 domain-containing protein n=1 Tax=Chitiniphilus eburneus TaxID=2571148 RepID=A0A4U0PZS9_9NEIS|nr:DUF971 domain-containing protein [Chitiniphilus eburneus]TJZ74186.1 DUF971 domain-containing protein [Chitiniphilus eburneus]
MTPHHVTLTADALALTWPDGDITLPAPLLRHACRCADCRALTLRGMSPQAPAAIRLQGAEPIGHYALQLRFDDGHQRGIYPWEYLRQMAGLD